MINFDDLKTVTDDDIARAVSGGYGAEIRNKVRNAIRRLIANEPR